MYIVIRLIISLVCVFIGIYFFSKKSKMKKIKTFTISIISYCIIVTILYSIPIENAFLRFESPDSVFNYYSSGKIEDIVYNKDSAMIIYKSRNNVLSSIIIPKKVSYYKIPTLLTTRSVKNKVGNISFDVYNVLYTNDYYVVGLTVGNKNIKIIDNNGNNLKYINSENLNLKNNALIFYSSIDEYNSNYDVITE